VIIATVYILIVLLFCLAFYLVKIIKTCHQVLVIANNAIDVFTDNNLDDHAKEIEIQKSALRMVKCCCILLMKVVATLIIAALPLWLASQMRLVTPVDISNFALHWDVLIITTVVVILPVVLLRTENNCPGGKVKDNQNR